MDSTDTFEATSRVNLLEEQQSNTTKSQKPRLIVFIFFVFLLAAIIAAIITVYVISNTHLSLLIANPSDPIGVVCSVTRYRRSCYSSIANISTIYDGSDPESIAFLSIRVTSNQLSNLSSLLETLVSDSTNSAERDCRDMFLHALNLEDPVVTMEKREIWLMQSWLLDAKSGEENCMKRLIESQRTVGDELMMNVYKLKEYISNSLAIVSNMDMIRQKFYNPPPPELGDFVLILPQYLVLIFLFCLMFRLG